MSVRIKKSKRLKRTTGLAGILNKLNRQIKKIEEKTLAGLIKSAIIVRRDMDKTPPLIPVDFGNLRSSFFTVTSKGGIKAGSKVKFKGEDRAEAMAKQHSQVTGNWASGKGAIKGPWVVLGFTAYYAPFVHENIGANFKRPGAGAKFFEAALKRNKHIILKTIRDSAKVKK